MAPLNVIALVSGGKDSFFSILHCVRNGHRITALANLHPPVAPNGNGTTSTTEDEGEDINSYMYQTVGHTVIPLYAQALNLPLYRQEILGSAVNTSKDYSETGNDETESIALLLKKVLREHPEANAVSTGAILSTYQRTRVESVAVRLGLTPLSYLWQYPVLPPYEQAALLRDMAAMGQDARIIKVASGGLDQSFLWENVADAKTIARLSKAMARFGENGDGAVLGEGGEFETLAVNGPGVLWKERIEVEGSEVVGGEGGSAIWKGRGVRLVAKEGDDKRLESLRIPNLWDDEFKKIINNLAIVSHLRPTSPPPLSEHIPSKPQSLHLPLGKISSTPSTLTISNLCTPLPSSSPTKQLPAILSILLTNLIVHNLTPAHINHTTLLLRHMSTFASTNKIYSTFFTTPNPPSRVTVACGDTLPEGVDVMLSVICSNDIQERKGLHVQSRSYWAPANIGPYSQGISIPLSLPRNEDSDIRVMGEAVYIAGQIPLVPASMEVHSRSFTEQALLSLQHLFRIGRTMNVRHWTTGVAYISSCSDEEAKERVSIAQAVWRAVHTIPSASNQEHGSGEEEGEGNEDEDIDPWDQRNKPGAAYGQLDDTTHRIPIPDLDVVEGKYVASPCFVVQVSALPRDVDIEWSSLGLALPPSTSAKICTANSTDDLQYTASLSDTHFFQSRSLVQGQLDSTLQDVKDLATREGRTWEHCTLYATPGLSVAWVEAAEGIQWVPCQRVWGRDGEEVGGCLVGRLSSTEGVKTVNA